MRNLLRFCLTGFGYLEGIDATEKESVSARLRVMQLPFSDVSDPALEEVTVNCVTHDPEWVILVKALQKESYEGHSIIIKFQAAYSHFGFCHAGIKGDPEQMIQLNARLLRIDGWYRDGHWTNAGDPVEAASFLLGKVA